MLNIRGSHALSFLVLFAGLTPAGCGGGDSGGSDAAAAGPDSAVAATDVKIVIDSPPSDATGVKDGAGPDSAGDAPAGSGVVASFTIGTTKTDSTCESGGSSQYQPSLKTWLIGCMGKGGNMTLTGPGPTKGVTTTPTGHNFVLSNAGGVLSGAPSTMKLDVKIWEPTTMRLAGEVQAHWNASGGKPAADLTATFDVTLN